MLRLKLSVAIDLKIFAAFYLPFFLTPFFICVFGDFYFYTRSEIYVTNTFRERNI